MAADKAERAVHRLLDMVVEEVSLVDRAANQHRFLIVKRSEPMDQDTAAAVDATETPPDTEPAPPDTDDAVVDLNELPDDDGEDVPEAKAVGAAPSALMLAAQALEALTEAVEVLGTVSQEEAQARVAELAQELHAVATRLGGTTGTGDMPAAPPPTEGAPGLESVIASVRAVLERVGQMLAAPEPTPVEAKQPETAKAADGATTDAASAVLGSKLDSLVTELRSVGETVKEQQQRLARMEKRFGMPNSTPTGERPSRAEDDADVGWPLDLNRSLDRDSVDKSISFHDV